MLARIKEDDQTCPTGDGGFFYYSRTEKGKQYPIYCRKAGSLDAPEEVMLDLNAARRGPPFLALGAWQVSDDGHLLAYTTDVTGFREYTLLREGPAHRRRSLPDRIEKVASVAWAADGQTLFYVAEDDGQAPVPAATGTALGGRGGRRAALRGDGRAVPPRRRALAQPRATSS